VTSLGVMRLTIATFKLVRVEFAHCPASFVVSSFSTATLLADFAKHQVGCGLRKFIMATPFSFLAHL
jgi:hypothetical protein